MEQAKALKPSERIELMKLLIHTPDLPLEPTTLEPDQHWGKSLNRLFDQVGPIEMLHPEIEDPVEWVQHQRAEQRHQRLADWGEGNVTV